MTGHIHSVESMGLVDGPGIRTVIFFQGCPLRCLFCHNPDTWQKVGGENISSETLMKKILRFRPYFERSGGGVTFSGGEPLLQKEFLLEMLQMCKSEGIHTCLDTSGHGTGDYEQILNLCDMVLYDIKALDPHSYTKMCRSDIDESLNFVKALQTIKPRTVVRQVVIPGINDTDAYMKNLKIYIDKELPFAEAVELLPFHKMGEHKYAPLGIKPPLADTPPMDKSKAQSLQQKYFDK